MDHLNTRLVQYSDGYCIFNYVPGVGVGVAAAGAVAFVANFLFGVERETAARLRRFCAIIIGVGLAPRPKSSTFTSSSCSST